MKKKVLSLLLTAAMATTMMAGCGSGSDDSKKSDDGKSASTNTEASDSKTSEASTESAESAKPADLGSGTVKIWVSDGSVDFTQKRADQFMKDNGYDYKVEIEAVGEGDAATNMITDVNAGADVFSFAQDQLTRLVSAGALTPLIGDYGNFVAQENDEASASSVVVGGKTYAFPQTSDNGYFLFYDKSVVKDPSSLEGILADCEAAGKNFYTELNSGWYHNAFFFATGCDLSYETDDKGNFVNSTISVASPEGVVALREMIDVASSKAFKNGSAMSDAKNWGAIIDGMWDVQTAKDLLKDNLGVAKLPSFEGSDGKTYQLSGFSGFKLFGVKPQTEEGKAYVCLELAKYLTSTDVQIDRYKELACGPSNKKAQEDPDVQADKALTALREQLQFCKPQGQYPQGYWDQSKALGDDIIEGKKINAKSSDDDLTKTLQTYQDACAALK